MRPPLLLRLARQYGWYCPVSRGKRFLAGTALRLRGGSAQRLVVPTKYGGRFWVDVGDPMHKDLYFLGAYEPDVTEVVRRIVKPGDTVFDIGANFGWYSVLLASLVGPRGSLHSFEPVPWICAELKANLDLNPARCEMVVNQIAIGDRSGRGQMHTFAGLPHGHSSLSSLGRTDASTYPCNITTLDEYVAANFSCVPALIKCDVEGAELAVVEGSRGLLGSGVRPMWIVEINTETSRAFGYGPGDLLEALSDWEYGLYRITRQGIESLAERGWRHGDNVLCVAREAESARLGQIEAGTSAW